MISRRRLCALMLAAPLAGRFARPARAAGHDVHLMAASLSRVGGGSLPGLYLSASWEFDLSNTLTESLRRGIPLYFVYEFRLSRHRWYWVDKEIASASYIQRLSYSPLSREYRLSQGGLTQSFESLDVAAPLVKRVSGWQVAPADAIDNPEDYDAEVRMRLDLTKLPKPLQVTIGGNSDWLLESDWDAVRITAQAVAR